MDNLFQQLLTNDIVNSELPLVAMVVAFALLFSISITPQELADGDAGCTRISGTIVSKEIYKEGQIQTYVLYVVVNDGVESETGYAVIVGKDTYYEYADGFLYQDLICSSVALEELLAFWNDVLRNPWISEWSP